ncbi:MAG: hypothetical protein KAH56_01645 [Candidatus Krumholzibacteria bacterium]|nr:hypothetical protein [Candidatus Krumholzibacteria bacterium]
MLQKIHDHMVNELQKNARTNAIFLVAVALVLALCGSALAQSDFTASLLGTGHEEREDGVEGCLSESGFIAGVYNAVTQLQTGGNGYGCDSEWGAFTEFDFTGIGTSSVILSVSLYLRYTGYGDDAMGLPYIGVYGYEYAGGPVVLPRTELDDHTALAVFAPTSTTNVDIAVDVTDFITDLVLEGTFQTGFFVCGVFSEVGYNDMVYFGGSNHTHPPRLVITTANPVWNDRSSWGGLKSLFR